MQISNDYAVDSLKYRIAVEDCEKVSNELRSRTLEVDEYTGEVKAVKLKHRKEGSLNFKLSRAKFPGEGFKDCVYIGIPAKVLRQNYFDGITADNVQSIHSAILNTNLVNVSFDAFMKSGFVTDVDIKKDVVFRESSLYPKWDNQAAYYRDLAKVATPSTKKGRGVTLYNQKDNVGIDFGSRSSGTIGYPYLKMYAKIAELMSPGTLDFTTKCLKGLDTSDPLRFMRIEPTIKDKNHFQRVLGAFEPVLYNVLNLSQDELKRLTMHAWQIHVNKVTPSKQPRPDGLSPKDQVILNAINCAIMAGQSKYQVEHCFLSNIDCRVSRSRMRKLFDNLYCNYSIASNKDEIGALPGAVDFL